MKKNFTLFVAFAAALLTLFSCSADNLQPSSPESPTQPAGKTIRFNVTTEPLTKATLIDAYTEGDGFLGSWEEGDAISIYYLDGDEYLGATWTAEDGSNAFYGDDIVAGEHLYAYFPEYDGSFYFGSGRVQNGNNFNSDYDLMMSQPFDIEEDAESVPVVMERYTAIQYFHLTSESTAPWAEKHVISATLTATGEDDCIACDGAMIDGVYDDDSGSDILSVSESGDESDLSSDGDSDDDLDGGDDGLDGGLADGISAGIFIDGELNSITITFEEGSAPLASDIQLWFNVLPFSVEGLTITVVLEDGYVWTSTNDFSGEGFTYTEGTIAYASGSPTYTQQE